MNVNKICLTTVSLKKTSNSTQKTTEHNVTHNYILFKIVHFEHHLFEVVQDISDPQVKYFFPQQFPVANKQTNKQKNILKFCNIILFSNATGNCKACNDGFVGYTTNSCDYKTDNALHHFVCFTMCEEPVWSKDKCSFTLADFQLDVSFTYARIG